MGAFFAYLAFRFAIVKACSISGSPRLFLQFQTRGPLRRGAPILLRQGGGTSTHSRRLWRCVGAYDSVMALAHVALVFVLAALAVTVLAGIGVLVAVGAGWIIESIAPAYSRREQ